MDKKQIEQLAIDMSIALPDTFEIACKKLGDAMESAANGFCDFAKIFSLPGVAFTDRQSFFVRRMVKKEKGRKAYQKRYKNHG